MSSVKYDEGSFNGQPEKNKSSLDNLIANIYGRNKVISFHDALVPAFPEHYAQIHGLGGKAHAVVSGIKLVICDYSSGTGNKSTTVSANVEPTMFLRLAHVAESNMGEYLAPVDGIWNTAVQAERLQRSVLGTLGRLIQGGVAVLAAAVKGEKNAQAGFGRLLVDNQQYLKVPNDQEAMLKIPFTRDYLHTQTRVNSYRAEVGDFCPVSILSIQRQGWYNGQVRKLPWTIKIQNFEARMKRAENGTTSYDGSTTRNKREAYIQVSDEDFCKACYSVDRFVRVWEMAVGPAAVKKALKVKEEERNAR